MPETRAETPRFCDRCGLSLVPLDVPHASRPCTECGELTHLAEPGEGGIGVRVQEGDDFTIPAGAIKVSMDPRTSGSRLSRPGLAWFVSMLLASNLPEVDDGQPVEVSDLDGWLTARREEAEQILESSEKLAHLDLDTEAGAVAAVDLLKDEWFSIDASALQIVALVQIVIEQVGDGEVAEVARAAAHLEAAHAMLVYKRHLADHVWSGYEQTLIVYNIAAAGARTPHEAERIKALRPIFAALDEDVLNVWVETDQELGPLLGITDVPEDQLRAFARYHLNQFERRRQDERLEREITRAQPRSPWPSGSFYIAALVIVLGVLLVAVKLVSPLTFPIFVLSALLLFVVISAFQLRHDERLSERGFMALVLQVLRRSSDRLRSREK